MLNYRFIVKGGENWLTFKEVIAGFNHELIGKIKDGRGEFMYIAKINDVDLNAIKEAIKDVETKCYANTEMGCIEQAKDEAKNMKLSLDKELAFGYVRTNKLMDMLVQLGAM